MLNENKLVSIIVPVYNVSGYIRRCVDSILSQDYKNIEILLVDDGSPDDCPEICDEYAQSDRRVRVIHKKNGGLSDARNAGLHSAKGEYVAFIDSDDYVASNFISTLLLTVLSQNADISVCSYFKVFDNKPGVIRKRKNAQRTSFTNIEAMRDIFLTSSLCEVMTWNKLYKKELFIKNDVEFPVGKIHEDNFTTYKLFYYSSKVAFTNEPLYYYLQRSESIMGRGFSRKSLDMLEAVNLTSQWVRKYHLPLENEVEAYKLSTYVNLLNTMVDADAIDRETWKLTRSWILKNIKILLKNNFINKKQKFLLCVLWLGKVPYIAVRKIYIKRSALDKGVVR